MGQSWIQWKIDESKLCLLNRDILHKIRTLNSCFIHVRRGDYLSYDYKSLFSGCCTIDYYKRAVELMKKKYYDVRFICFSDDIPWVKENLKIDDAFYVDWNIGKDSPLDMYLMSQCKNGIIANSTFSYWGARLGYKKNTLCYPIKWWNEEKGNPDIFLEGWIGL